MVYVCRRGVRVVGTASESCGACGVRVGQACDFGTQQFKIIIEHEDPSTYGELAVL